MAGERREKIERDRAEERERQLIRAGRREAKEKEKVAEEEEEEVVGARRLPPLPSGAEGVVREIWSHRYVTEDPVVSTPTMQITVR